ncbi:VanZ family protein [Candidatus Omnitrophota bacterium]
MTKKSLRAVWWSVTLLYITFIFATLGVMPRIWPKIDSLLAGKSVLAIYVIYSIVGALTLNFILFIKRERSYRKYILFFLFIGIIIATIKLVKLPAEKIHVAEYGLLGVLFYNALKVDFDRFGKKLYIYGIIACLIIGILDEIIQLILPNRYFGWSDIVVNSVCAIVVLLMIKFVILTKQ